VNLPTEQLARLQQLAQAVQSTTLHLQATDRGVFAQPFTAERAAGLDSDVALAERMGWIAKPDDWMRMRRLRNQMAHEYSKDPAVLADALQRGHDFVPVLVAATAALVAELPRRGWA
jgi:hypothetical protein